jgi:hypothetical protein
MFDIPSRENRWGQILRLGGSGDQPRMWFMGGVRCILWLYSTFYYGRVCRGGSYQHLHDELEEAAYIFQYPPVAYNLPGVFLVEIRT